MRAEHHRFGVESKGDTHVIDLTDAVRRNIASGTVRNGLATIFVVGSTAAITTTEYEPGLVQKDLRDAYQRIAPDEEDYAHEATWHDDNGHAHVRATLTGPSLTVPLVNGEMTLGTWQQIVLIDFDTRPRQREIVVQVLGCESSAKSDDPWRGARPDARDV